MRNISQCKYKLFMVLAVILMANLFKFVNDLRKSFSRLRSTVSSKIMKDFVRYKKKIDFFFDFSTVFNNNKQQDMNVYTDDQVTRNVRYILVSKSLTYTLNALSN